MNSDVSVIFKYFAYAKYIINYIKFNVDIVQLKCILLLNYNFERRNEIIVKIILSAKLCHTI